MKWFSLPTALYIVALGATSADADLLNRADRLIDHRAPVDNSIDGPTLSVTADDAVAPIPGPELVQPYGEPYVGSAGGYGVGCCEQDVGFARSLWSGYCAGRKPFHHRLRTCLDCCKPACGAEAPCCDDTCGKFDFHWRTRACCKPRLCLPKFDFHWAHWGGGKAVCDEGYVSEPVCFQKPQWHHKMFGWMHRSHGCDVCGLSECDGCAKTVGCQKPQWHHKMFGWMKRGPGCDKCAMGDYQSDGGEIWSDASETRIIDTPPMPEPQGDRVSAPSLDHEARRWPLPQTLRLFPAKLGL